MTEPDDTLAAALTRHAIELEPEQIAALDRYCQILWEWNAKMNLTRHTDYEKFVARDVVDSLAFSQFIEPDELVLDVGTGGGVPGVVLAIARPDLSVELCESVAKRARAVREIVEAIPLSAAVHHARAETLLEENNYYDVLVVRAVAPLPKLLGWFAPYWGRFRRLLVLKGPAWTEERHAARESGLLKGLELRRRLSYPLPGTDSESVLLEIWPSGTGEAGE